MLCGTFWIPASGAPRLHCRVSKRERTRRPRELPSAFSLLSRRPLVHLTVGVTVAAFDGRSTDFYDVRIRCYIHPFPEERSFYAREGPELRHDRPRGLRGGGGGGHCARPACVQHRGLARHGRSGGEGARASGHPKLGVRVPHAPHHGEPCARRPQEGRSFLRPLHRCRNPLQLRPDHG